ncbi:hypothetical protein JCM8208_006601 [Rhodotorula glutinis]
MARLGLDAKYSTQRPRFALLPTRPPSISLPPPSSHRASGSDSPSFPATPAALLHAFASLSPRAKKLFAAAIAAILLLGAPIVRRAGDRGHDYPPQAPPAAHSRSFKLPPVTPQRTAADGTPRAGLFHPLASAASNNPSVSLSAYLDSHFGPPTRPLEQQPHVWLTMADALWARTGTAALHAFVERLNSERRARYGKRDGGVRDTRLVVMCLDDGCVDEVAKYKDEHGRDAGGGFAYGGFRWNRPDKKADLFARSVSTWPKLAAFIEVLPHRDLFFVDSDVAFRYDPYPYMEPFMATHDLVAQENDSFDHLNTGWMWIRRSQAAADAWHEVLKMDLEKTSRDQNNFNEVLGTALLRQHLDGGDPRRKPLLADFTAKNGLRVHVLDDNIFRSHHFGIDRPYAARDQSIYIHLTCGDDTRTKVYVSKAQGFWSDVEHYYSEPPPLLTVDHLSGDRDDVEQLFKVLLTAAHYTSRTLLPPTHATFLDLEPSSSSTSRQTRRIYSSFPIPHIAEALGVPIVEPRYTAWAARELVGGSVLGMPNASSSAVDEDDGERGGASRLRLDVQWSGVDLRRRNEKVASLAEVVELDMRHTDTLTSFLSLLRSPSFSSDRAPVVKIINYDFPGATHWRDWELPRALDHVRTCDELEKLPACDAICRGSKKGVKVDETWPSWEELAGEQDGDGEGE